MNSQCKSYLRRHNWAMKSQVLCLSISISVVIVLAIYLIGNMFFKLAQETFVEASQSMFDQQTTKQLHNYLDRLQKQTTRTFQSSQQNLKTINEIYQMVEDKQFHNALPPLRALDDPNDNDTYAYTQSFTYMFGSPQAEVEVGSDKNQQLRNLTAILTEALPIMCLKEFTYFTDSNQDEYFSVVEGQNLVGYRPHDRPWYKDHITKMYDSPDQTIYSNPYLASAVPIIFIALTQNLTYLNNSFAGVVAQDVGLQSLPKISGEQTTFMIVNETGYMIICQYYFYGNKNIRTIYNQSITGLTLSDWFLIKELGDFNRQLDYIEIQNTTSQQMLYVTCVKLQYPNYYLIAYYVLVFIRFTRNAKFEFDKNQIQMKLQGFIDEFYLQFVLSIFTCLIVITLIQLAIIKLLLSPINNLKYLAESLIDFKRLIKSQKSKAKLSTKQTLLSRLYSSYNNLLKNLGKSKGNNQTLISLQKNQYLKQIPHFGLDINLSQLWNGVSLIIKKSLIIPRQIQFSNLQTRQLELTQDDKYITVGNYIYT